MKEIAVSRYLNMELTEFLNKMGAKDGNTSYPGHVYLSTEDAAQLRRANRRMFRAKYPYASKLKIDSMIGTFWLMYGPNQSISKAVRPGYALVEVEAIEADKRASRTYEYKVTAVAAPLTLWQRIKNSYQARVLANAKRFWQE